MKKITLLLLTFTFHFSFFAQQDYKLKAQKKDANFFEIVKSTRSYFNSLQAKSTKKVIKQKKQFERWVYYWKDRVNKNGTFPSETLGYYNADILDNTGKIKQPNQLQQKSSENWINIGPSNNPEPNGYSNYPQLGRLNTFLRIKHPSDRNQDVLFVGAPAGGIWKSTDNGATWSAKTDFVAGIGITHIATASTTNYSNYTTKPIYVSTGDYDASHVKSIGVLKSTDGGETFTSTGLSFTIGEGKSTGQLIVMDDNTVMVGANRYIKKTTNGGTSWTNHYDSGFDNANFGRVAVNGSKIMYTSLFDIYYSANNGDTWSAPFFSNDQDKHAVTVGSDGEFYLQNESGQMKTFNTTNSTFSNLGSVPPGYTSQGGYNQTLIVKDGLIVSGEFNGQTSTNNGTSWNRTINGYYNPNAGPGPKNDGGEITSDGIYVHSDHHGMGILDGQFEFWSVNDGGLNFINYTSASDVKPTTEYKSNGVVVSQLYDVAITPNLNTGNYIMALQDNDGYSREMHNGSMQWIAAAAGDGVCGVINYNNPSIRYLGSQNGGLTKTGSGFSGVYDGESWGSIQGAAFVWPLEIHTTDPTILYAGGDDVYKITDATGNADLNTSISNANKLNAGAGQIEKISTHGSGIAVVGNSASKLSKNDGSTWTTITNPSGETINSVDFDQANMDVVYCSVSGYSNGNKIYKSTNGGTSWTNISTGLPNIVMKEIVVKQNESTETLFAATELGVYFKYGTQDWKKLGQSLPNVIVNDIDINYTENRLVAATFGRGLWHINIANSTLSVNDNISLENPFKIYPNPVSNGKLTYSLSENLSDFQYKIYNVIGGVVLEGKKNAMNGTINVSSLNNGIYMFKAFKDGKDLPTVKLIINNN